jgi:hypothetical protein
MGMLRGLFPPAYLAIASNFRGSYLRLMYSFGSPYIQPCPGPPRGPDLEKFRRMREVGPSAHHCASGLP